MSKRATSAAKAFGKGFLSAFDVGLRSREATKRALSATPREADARKLAGDWQSVGGDLRVALEKVAAESNAKTNGER